MNWEEKYNAIAELVDNYRRERDDAREQLYLTKAELGRWVDRETKAVRERESYQNRVARLEEAIVTSLGQRLEPCMSRHPVTVDMAAGSLFFKIGEAMSCEFQDGDDLLEAVKELVRERDEARAEAAMLEDRLSESRAEVERITDERDELPVRVANQEAELRATREAYNESRAEVERLMHQLADATNESTHFQVMCKRETEEVERLTSELQRERKCLTETRRELASQYGMGFRRGAEAMREACAQWVADYCSFGRAAAVRALPIPEES
jgi:predicted  nucleic acid-binding Zn-ribbon protein